MAGYKACNTAGKKLIIKVVNNNNNKATDTLALDEVTTRVKKLMNVGKTVLYQLWEIFYNSVLSIKNKTLFKLMAGSIKING
jgi:hypothetical protein